jgi:hypothetical protein
VLDIDQKRRKSLAYISEVSRAEQENALPRIRGNTQLQAKISYYRNNSAPTWVREQSLAAAR